MRKLPAIEAARGSLEAAGAVVTHATGVRIGNGRQRSWSAGAPRTWSVLPVARDPTGAGSWPLVRDLRREGHRDAAGRAAARYREGRCRRGEQAGYPAVARGVERPQADGRAGLRR